MLRAIPQGWRLHWAPRAMRATILSANGNPLIEMQPESAEGRHQFGDWVTLMQHAPQLLAALESAVAVMEAAARNSPTWAQQAIADGRAAIAAAKGEG